MNAFIKLVNFCLFVLKILSGNEILNQTLISDFTNVRKMACSNLNLGLVDINSYIKLGKILLSSEDIERKRNYDGRTDGRNGGQPKSSIPPPPFFFIKIDPAHETVDNSYLRFLISHQVLSSAANVSWFNIINLKLCT